MDDCRHGIQFPDAHCSTCRGEIPNEDCGCNECRAEAERIIEENLQELVRRIEEKDETITAYMQENKKLREAVALAESGASRYKRALEKIVKVDGSHDCVESLVKFAKSALIEAKEPRSDVTFSMETYKKAVKDAEKKANEKD